MLCQCTYIIELNAKIGSRKKKEKRKNKTNNKQSVGP